MEQRETALWGWSVQVFISCEEGKKVDGPQDAPCSPCHSNGQLALSLMPTTLLKPLQLLDPVHTRLMEGADGHGRQALNTLPLSALQRWHRAGQQ